MQVARHYVREAVTFEAEAEEEAAAAVGVAGAAVGTAGAATAAPEATRSRLRSFLAASNCLRRATIGWGSQNRSEQWKGVGECYLRLSASVLRLSLSWTCLSRASRVDCSTSCNSRFSSALSAFS